MGCRLSMHGGVRVVRVGSGVDTIRSRAKVYCNNLLTLVLVFA
jgi:hypothetical protein